MSYFTVLIRPCRHRQSVSRGRASKGLVSAGAPIAARAAGLWPVDDIAFRWSVAEFTAEELNSQAIAEYSAKLRRACLRRAKCFGARNACTRRAASPYCHEPAAVTHSIAKCGRRVQGQGRRRISTVGRAQAADCDFRPPLQDSRKIPIASGTVASPPTIASARPAARRWWRFSRPASSRPMPMPMATRVPVQRINCGIVSVRGCMTVPRV